MRTDGSARYFGLDHNYPNDEPWLAPWLQRRLPKGSDPADWVLAQSPERTKGKIVLRHIVSGDTVEVVLRSELVAGLPSPLPMQR